MTIGNNRNRGCPKKINTPLGSQENNERELWLKWHFVLPQYWVEGKVVGSKPIGACPKFFGSAMDPQKVKSFQTKPSSGTKLSLSKTFCSLNS